MASFCERLREGGEGREEGGEGRKREGVEREDLSRGFSTSTLVEMVILSNLAMEDWKVDCSPEEITILLTVTFPSSSLLPPSPSLPLPQGLGPSLAPAPAPAPTPQVTELFGE